MQRTSAGHPLLDGLLGGGYETDALTCVYGPPGSGKTTLAMLATIATIANKKRVIYIDTEGNFSLARFAQLTPKHKELLNQIVFLKPVDFDEQAQAFEKLRSIVDPKKIGLIVLDGAAMLYRLELGKNRDVYSVNREFGVQLSYLTEIARRQKIPVVVTNQVYADFDEEGNVKIVGGDILRYASKCLIEIRKLSGGIRAAIVRKHRALPEDVQIAFRITQDGIVEAQLPGPKVLKDKDFTPADELEQP